jgi:hypothetical protein
MKYSFIEKSELKKKTQFLKSEDLYPFFKEVNSAQTDVAYFGDKKSTHVWVQ